MIHSIPFMCARGLRVVGALVAASLLLTAPPTSADDLTPAQKAFLDNDVVKKRVCTTCHAVGGTGGTVGPKLDQAGNRRAPEWIRRWLKDPAKVRPGTLMPNFQLTDEEIESLVGLITQLKVPLDTRGVMSGDGDDVAKGQKLFVMYDCFACHRNGDEGRFIGPDLTWLSRRRTPEWETAWLSSPETVKPNTFMPNFRLPNDERDALVAYLMTLDGQANEASQNWEANTAFQLNSRPREVGERVYKRFGCDGCHGRKGEGGFTNPNAQPDGQMPPIFRAMLDNSADDIKSRMLVAQKPAKIDPAGQDPLPCPSWDGAITDSELETLIAFLEHIAPEE